MASGGQSSKRLARCTEMVGGEGRFGITTHNIGSDVSESCQVAEILYINLGLAYQSFHGDLTAIDHP